jgi:hypothetical protein
MRHITGARFYLRSTALRTTPSESRNAVRPLRVTKRPSGGAINRRPPIGHLETLDKPSGLP